MSILDHPHGYYWRLTGRRLTGRFSTRVQKWTGRLVLRVEETASQEHITGRQQGADYTYWRDAQPTDLLPILGKPDLAHRGEVS